MDIVYAIKSWPSDCIELRYSLRSLRNIPHGNVFIIGYKPERVRNIIHIPFRDDPKYKAKNVIEKIKLACQDPRLSDTFVFMCDDFYIRIPITDVPYYWKWYISQHLQIRENMKKKWRSFFTFSCDVIRKTFKLTDKDFENHFPFIYEKDKYLKMLDTYDFSTWNLYRSAYCKLYGIPGEYHRDCKLALSNYKKRDLSQFTFFSSRNDFAKTEKFVMIMDRLFPDKSEYEA